MPLEILNTIPPAVLKNKTWQQQLNREGIISFPFLETQALAELNELYHSLHPTTPNGPIENFYVSTHSPDLNYKLTVQNRIKQIIEPACKIHFQQYRITTSAFIVKKTSPQSELGLHQDWNVVDESQFASYGLWLPLIDITIHNGAMFAIPRSHRIGPTYRHTALPSVFSNIGNSADKYLVPFEVKAGHALLFNQAILHKSAPNLSSELRTTAVSTIVPEKAPHIMYARSNENLDTYLIDDNTVQHFYSFFEDSVKVPTGAIKTGNPITADFTPIQPEAFGQLYQLLMQKK